MPRLRPPHLLITSLLLLGATSAWAQDRGTISGRVVDKRTNHAIPFASVGIVGLQKGGLTDSEGQYLISNVPVGTYEVRVQYLGYKNETRPGVVVAAGKAVAVNFQLEDVVVVQEKAVEVTADRRLVEVKQGATIRSVGASEIRNMPVQTIGEVLQQQAGINTENDQIHVRGGRADETVFVVNGVANRDLVTGQSTAGQLNARSVAEVNVATGAYDVRYGNALSGIVEVKLKEGGDRFTGGITLQSQSYGGRSFQTVVGGPDPIWKSLFTMIGLKPSGTMTSILDLSGTLYDTRFYNFGEEPVGMFERLFEPWGRPRLKSSYEDSFLGMDFKYGNFFTPAEDNRWSARYGLTWKPNTQDRMNFNFSKRIGIDQGFSRTFITAQGDQADPAYPWIWNNRIDHAGTIFEDNVQSSLEWRRTLSTTGFFDLQLSRYFFAQRQDVMGKHWSEFEEPDDLALDDPAKREDFFIDSGDDDVWQDRRTETYALQFGITQRKKRHEFEFGFDHEWQAVQYLTIEQPWVFDPSGLGSAHDLWKVHPWVGNLYARDRLEYEGFIANIGMRVDYWFVGREAEQALADTSNPNMDAQTRDSFYENSRSFFGRRYKAIFSPRIIVAHPITENSSFFFNYGRFTQVPSYRFVYQKLTSVSSEAFPYQGNPDLNPQVSVNYELGAKHQFRPTAAINATFFVKDIYDYPTATAFDQEQGDTLVRIYRYLNGHYARAKGFEIELEKRRSNHWAGKISYTYQQTKGKSSDPNEITRSSDIGAGEEVRLGQVFTSWNRPHKVSASFDMRYPRDDENKWLRGWGLNVYLQGQSGRPYTPMNSLGDDAGEPNSKNAIFQNTVDARLNYAIPVMGRRVDVSLQALNLFDNRLVYRVDRVTGTGRVWGEGQYDPAVFDVDEFTKISQVDDPSNYGTGRQWRMALDYDF